MDINPVKIRINRCRYDLIPIELEIMGVVSGWVKHNKKPVTSRKIVEEVVKEGFKEPAILVAIRRLVLKGYLRKNGYRPYSYALLRSVPV